MCEPTTIMAVGTLVLGAVSAKQQYDAGKAEQKMYQQQAAVDRVAADDARALGDRESERMLWRTRAALGEQRAAIGAAGIDPTFGTPAELLGETAYFGAMEQQDARLNAARQAWGHEVDATNAENRGSYAAWSGKQQATGTILGSLFQAGSMVQGSGGFGRSGRRVGGVQREAIPVPKYRPAVAFGGP